MSPTGVTRHALAQLQGLASRPGIALSLVTGRMSHPDGLAYWESLERQTRHELPVRTRDILRWWRLKSWPPIEWWTGPVDWVYCPAEFLVATRHARRAVTSHDVWQTLQFEPAEETRTSGPRFRACRPGSFGLALQHPATAGGVSGLPGPRGLRTQRRRRSVLRAGDRSRAGRGPRGSGLPPEVPYLLSVANFQPRKNLVRLIDAAARLPEVSAGELALVLIGTGAEEEERLLRERACAAGRKVLIRMPGYRQGHGAARRLRRGDGPGVSLRSARASASRPSKRWHKGSRSPWPTQPLCPKSAARQGGTSIRRSTPRSPPLCASFSTTRRSERVARALGRTIAERYRWRTAHDLLVEALVARSQ